ncbi:uncharacterized protein N0V89_002058 [Didymosphaeria variabile]|uniref:Alpha/beta-hydrolase n=1 Tax=Didymosphaeria variabile TaxID=1932322 RepID=A0A9W8XU31_9PLEO|nr:uncharacterized protein N0V89_002058 [Didymosphaeria variabile]KAJ4357482.1 hypothetical protein N0V89_002058 [Didymosphaeria variabile]
MVPPIVKKSYWTLAVLGGIWALLLALVYMHKLHHGYFQNVKNPEEFGFAKGQVTPFWLETSDREKLFCWHVLPLDVYLDHERELVSSVQDDVVESGEFKNTLGARLLREDKDGWRPSIYRSMSGISHTHTLVCDYRGFGISTTNNKPHLPTETGLITDGISIVSFVLNELQHPASRTILLGQSLGTAVTAATALYFTDPDSALLPQGLVHPPVAAKAPQPFAGVILAAAFTDLPTLLKTYKVKGIVPILSPLQNYPKIANFLSARIIDTWPTLARLRALITAATGSSTPFHITILHARNDQEFPFQIAETVYSPLETLMLAEEGASSVSERRSIQGGERVQRGAFAYRKVETKEGERTVEVEVVRYGGHSEGVGWGQVNLAVRRAWRRVDGEG